MNKNDKPEPKYEGQLDDSPPFFRKWSDIYTIVMVILFILIGLFYMFSVFFQ